MVYAGREHRIYNVFKNQTVRLGALVVDQIPLGYAVCPTLISSSWTLESGHYPPKVDLPGPADPVTLPNGWTRFNASDIVSPYYMHLPVWMPDDEPWLSQANSMFTMLHITSEHERYCVINEIEYSISFTHKAGTLSPPGYFFVCPKAHLQAADGRFSKPADPAYWALDELGAEPINAVQAELLGFPSFAFGVHATGHYWPSSAYEGLRDFHRGKGFNSESQDVARHLGYSLWEVAPDYQPMFAHIDEMNDTEMGDIGAVPDDDDRMMVDFN
ncbi:hypothetical protein C8R44DRAFT_799332 [Mycena epipterygia]|nr:hypothetical protein C8R44DRAFT_799332 [Mycena epipterygia]